MKRLLVTLLVAAIVAFPLCYVMFFSPTKTPPSSPTINVVLRVQQYKDGSVLFWKDGFLINPILKNTGSHLTHAALILDGYVYEAVPPCVHKVPLAKYLKEMKDKSQIPFQEKRGFTWIVVQPKVPYTATELLAMRGYAESQLGRPYMMRGYWKGHEVRGIMCSQYAGNAIGKTGRIVSSNFHESPGSLYEKLKEIYQ